MQQKVIQIKWTKSMIRWKTLEIGQKRAFLGKFVIKKINIKIASSHFRYNTYNILVYMCVCSPNKKKTKDGLYMMCYTQLNLQKFLEIKCKYTLKKTTFIIGN